MTLTNARFLDFSADVTNGELGNHTVEDLQAIAEECSRAAQEIDVADPTADDLLSLDELGRISNAVKTELARRLGTADSRRQAADRIVKSILASGTDARDAAQRLGTPTGRRLPSMRQLSAHQRRQGPASRPTSSPDVARAVLTAGGDLDTVTPHSEIELERLGRAAMSKFTALAKANDPRGDGEKVYFATLNWEYPADRQLSGDPVRDREKINQVVSSEALTASGGICGPVAVDYSVLSIAANDRPVRDALAVFGAARGGLRYILPHTLAQVTADGPASVWTEATDANPGGNTKPHATFTCQSVQESYVDAVTAIVQFGNFQARYFPEQITQYLEAVDAVHSRLADATLLAAISGSSSTAKVTASNYEIGAARDFLAEMDRASAAYRYRNRMAPDAPLRLIAPSFLRSMMRADLTRNLPGDSGGQTERLATTDAQIDAWLAARDLNPSWAVDSITTGNGYSGNAVLQGFVPQGNGILAAWPANTAVWLFHEGAWVFLDGGELNLGMVRDSTLNKTNDFQMFTETFEKAIFRGHESDEILMKLSPLGTTIGTVGAISEPALQVSS